MSGVELGCYNQSEYAKRGGKVQCYSLAMAGNVSVSQTTCFCNTTKCNGREISLSAVRK